jgi:SNF2 family DNA or RNA helicase
MAPTLTATLLPYQSEATDWCLKREADGCILAYDMGLGKTVIACAVMAENPVKTVVMVPTSLLPQWVSEIQKHTTGFRVAVYHGTQRHSNASQAEMRRADIVLSTVPVIARDLHNGLEIPAGRWIVDEAHRLKNSTGVSYDRLYAEADGIAHKIFLTGTPVCNRCDDLIALLCLTNRIPYNEPKSWKRMKEPAKIVRLQEVLPDALLRRTKEDTIPELLPTLTTKNIPLKMPFPGEQSEFYSSFMDEEELLLRILRMRQSANSHGLLKEQFQKRAGVTEPLPATEMAVKVAALKKLLKRIPSGEKVLVFSQFTSLLSHLHGQYPNTHFYHGGLTAQEKSEVIAEFKTSASASLLFINLRAGGCGLNLTEANHVILLEPYWNESEQKQAIDRVYRIGQTRPVTVYRMYLRRSVESWLHALQKTKQTLANFLIQPTPETTLESIAAARSKTATVFQSTLLEHEPNQEKTTHVHTNGGGYCTLDEFLEREGIF